MLPHLTSLWLPGRFVLARGLRCAWQFEAETTLPWELFRGQLLPPRQTRRTRTFLAWNLLPVENGVVGGDAILSMLLDESNRTVAVVRGLRSLVWTPVDSAEGIAGEDRPQWVREYVGEVSLDAADAGSELQDLLFRAVVGTSRLPLTSLETPLPLFAFGELLYAPAPLDPVDSQMPMRGWRDLLARLGDVDDDVAAKIVEFAIRSAPVGEIVDLGDALRHRFGASLPRLFRRMFNDVSLSPYTDFVDKAFALFAQGDPLGDIDFLAGLLEKLGRHLTAYDLTLFHYRGANYPDALVLDAAFARLLRRIDEDPAPFLEASPRGRRRRRAIRVAALLRRQYEGHAVPDFPTSPGENRRVLPEPFAVLDETQIDEPHRRRRRLYDHLPIADAVRSPAARDVLRRSLIDLAEPDESREGGISLFIDRPLGFFKAPAEVDQTPLLSDILFSRRLAAARLRSAQALAETLAIDLDAEFWKNVRDRFDSLIVPGLPLDKVPQPRRPAVSLADARKVSDDFVIVATTPGTLRAFWKALAIGPPPATTVVRWLDDAGTCVAAFDAHGQLVSRFEADWSAGSLVRRGVEVPGAGLRFLTDQESAARDEQ